MRTVFIRKRDLEEMIASARNNLPNEACGLIGGKEGEKGRIIEKVYVLTNLDSSPEHFTLDPKEQLAAVKDMRANGLIPLGNWHSHPETPARPSREDIRLGFDPSASYLILSLMGDSPVLRSFHVEKGEAREETLVVREEE